MKYFNLHKFKDKRQGLRNESTKAEIMLWAKLKNGNFLDLKYVKFMIKKKN